MLVYVINTNVNQILCYMDRRVGTPHDGQTPLPMNILHPCLSWVGMSLSNFYHCRLASIFHLVLTKVSLFSETMGHSKSNAWEAVL